MKRFLLCLISVLLVLGLQAAPVSLQRATDVANNFLTMSRTQQGLKRVPVRARLVSDRAAVSSYYVFENEAGGFVIVAGDDIAYPILGYSNEAKWEAQSAPTNVEAWLAAYASEIKAAVDSGEVQSELVERAWANLSSYSDAAVIVSPLIMTRWNQSPYYNDMCPMDASRGERTVTGCVATAMAQVLKYWDYPTQGNGSHSYTHALGQQSADFAATTYDWANMPLELTSSSTDVQKAAVATLMYHCGVSVDMNYGVASTGGSGAYTISSKSNGTHCAEYALREYWGYKPTLKGLQKTSYKDADWKTMLKDELKAGRPVIYSGQGDGGHCFVCDGYDENEYFHFNWGWGGLYDGFFKLNALEPGTGGTGSGAGKYNNDQQAIFGVEPLRSLEETPSANVLVLASNVSISSSQISYKEGFSITASVKNTASAGFTGELGLALYDSGLELLTVMDAQSTTLAAGASDTYTFGTEGWSELVAGLYYAAIYSKTASGEWESVGAGTYRNMVQFRIGDDAAACVESILIYECDFESELLGWTFAKADGINTGFAVGSAIKYQGEKSMYVSPDEGQTSAYTQDNDKGYVSVAYKKMRLEPGNYKVEWRYFCNLRYLDVDADYYRIAVVPATNNIEPLAQYENNPSFLTGSLLNQSYSSNRTSWTSDYWSFTVSRADEYYLVYTFNATDKIVHENGTAIDNIKLTKILPKFELSMQETLEGCNFTWGGNFSEYRIRWYTDCEKTNKRDTLYNEHSYLIPYTKLRDLVYGSNSLFFAVTGVCDDGKTQEVTKWNYVYTKPFPNDTCPAVPTNLKAVNTDLGVKVTWQGNPGVYDFKYGTNSAGCDYKEMFRSTTDTAFLIPYSKFASESTHYFFVRGICPNDTSIWQRVSLGVKGPNACSSEAEHAKPCDFYAQNTSEGIMLTWKGNAPRYEVECRSEDEYYKRGDKYRYNDSNYVRLIADDEVFTIPYGTLSDTLYHFRVRAICEKDTSYWTTYISAYNINFGDYCIPFYDLCGPNTLCTYGSYSSPYSTKKTMDFRQKDWAKSYYKREDGYRYGISKMDYYRSRHTICFEGEVDPHCDSLLTTVPEGEKYSMRLGNWYNGEGESVTFTHKIDSGYKLILLLKYAVVLQDPSHTSKENPHFTLEILDEKDKLLDEKCWYADFAADKDAEGWRNAVNAHEPTKEEFRNIVWKDWTTIGVNLSNLSQYGDRTIKIRLTTKDCTRGQHFGYAYFTLNCTTSDLKGMSCGTRPVEFEVPVGFKYNWYLMDDTTKTTVCNTNVFTVQPTDTNSYHVDLISLENDECYYTMDAYTLPRMPRPEATFTHTPHDCVNEVTIDNTSYIYKIMLDGTEQRDGRIGIDSIQWDFGEYGTSTDLNPTLIIPNEGDTFDVTLRVVAGNMCAQEVVYRLNIPAIRDTITTAHRYLCMGDTLRYHGKEYYTAGVYTDSLKRAYGCDSVHILTVEYLEPEYKYYYDTICAVDVPYDFFGKQYTLSGMYEEHIQSTIGCDTIIHQLHLVVLDSLIITIPDEIEHGRECGEFTIPYTLYKGQMVGYSIAYSADAKANGFVDEVNDGATTVVVKVPSTCDSKTYDAVLIFHNGDCPALEIPFSFTITLYSKPESKAAFTQAPYDCINYVQIENQSAVYKYYNEDNKVLDVTQEIDSYLWDLGEYGQSTLAEPELIVPQEGDTFAVSLTTTYGKYTHKVEYVLEIPSILSEDGYTYQYICPGQTINYEGKDYNAVGQYILDETTNAYGCDSTSYLVIDYLQREIIDLYDTICYTALPYQFYDQSCSAAGVYEHTVKAIGGCDSVLYKMHLHVYESLNVELNDLADICVGDVSFDVNYRVTNGEVTKYAVSFSNEAKAAGFVDTVALVEDNMDWFAINLPKDVMPNTYSAEISFENHDCDVVTLPLSISVLYSSEIITQRWNDVIAVRQYAYDYYEGFSTYQWYRDGLPIAGADQSVYYNPDGLHGSTYQVEVTRSVDGVKTFSCQFLPTDEPSTSTLKVQPTMTRPKGIVQVSAPENGVMSMVNNVGGSVNNVDIDQGENSVVVPSAPGLYMILLTTPTGNKYVQKIIVY